MARLTDKQFIAQECAKEREARARWFKVGGRMPASIAGLPEHQSVMRARTAALEAAREQGGKPAEWPRRKRTKIVVDL